MKTSHAWFSLVELLVVSIILTLLSVFSISTFQTNRQEQALRDEVWLVSQTAINLDNQLGISIVDYQITLMTWAYYLVENNTLSQSNSPKVELSGVTLLITAGVERGLRRSINSLWIWESEKGISKDISMGISNTATYTIKGIKDGSDITESVLYPYARIDQSNKIILQSIEDGSWNLYSSGKILHRFHWPKQYIFSGTTLTPPLTLHFLANGDAMEYKMEE